MSGLPILLGGALFLYMVNRENNITEFQDNERRVKDAKKTINQRNKQVKVTKEMQDDIDTELQRKGGEVAGNNTMSGGGTYDSLPNEQTEPLPPPTVEDSGISIHPEESQKQAQPSNEYEATTIKDNGKCMKKSQAGDKIN